MRKSLNSLLLLLKLEKINKEILFETGEREKEKKKLVVF